MGILKETVWIAGLTIAATSFASETGPVEDLQAAFSDLRGGASDVVRGFLDPIFEDLIKALDRRS